ncbi:hypothetical protein [Caballeronia sp. LZ035]|uniref:hypothetical protein n=1 Tax=Caballeronia sp. LZ035 TaxID=3038568 RepID=UPI00285E4BDB|nr:hypothetical protein [Caballeronia sp. LZ035]MDR5758208.1 hypothetical protein [Caballeronia sp. LZ035]
MKCALAALALSLPVLAHAVSFEAGVSSTNYGTQGDGTWYQQGLPHVLNLHTYGFSAGVTGTLYSRGSYGMDWHVDYVNLGHVSSSCDCTPIDANYSVPRQALIKQPGYNAPLATFVGNGNAQGIALTLEPWIMYGGTRFGIEAGLFPYRPSWDVSVYNWQVTEGAAPRTLAVSTPHGLQLGQVVGVSIGRGNATLSLKHYFLPTKFDETHTPALWKGANVVEFKYRF